MKLKFEPVAPIQVLFCVVLFSAESENFQNFWPKTMDYSKAFWSNAFPYS